MKFNRFLRSSAVVLAGLAPLAPAVAAEPTSTTAAGLPAQSQQDAATAAAALIARVLPGHAGDFVCEVIPKDGGHDVFEIAAQNGKIVLRGNDGVSLAMAFHWYLRLTVKTGYDWQATGPLVIAGALPAPKTERHVCLARDRFFLNYCTYGYTFPFTRADQWERFVDWMAMNGINRPLMQCGQEAVWLRVWKSYGIPEDKIRAYFTGPAHLPWHRMTNIDKVDGPLPMTYIEGQAAMQKKLLAQARSLGMQPVLSGFAGHVPGVLKEVQPTAKITHLHGWGGVPRDSVCWFLDPTDPLFVEIQKKFIAEQTALYGTDHRYAADPFNEVDPPSWAPDYMANVGKGIYEGMQSADTKAVWYQMAWAFYYDKKWMKKSADGMTPLRALCEAVPKGKMILIDYVCEEVEVYRQTNNFFGASFLWDYVGNYGGNTYLRADMKDAATKIARALPVPNCLGVGSVLEGVNCNPVLSDMVFEQPWFEGGVVDDKSWIADYAVRRAGRDDAKVVEAWKLMLDKVLNPGPKGHGDRGSALTARPPGGPKGPPPPKTALVAEPRGRPASLQRGLTEAIGLALEASPETQKVDAYRYDLVNWMRQAIAWHSDTVKARLDLALKQHDKAEIVKQTRIMLGLLRDMDELVGTRHEFLLGPWIRDARSWGKDAKEADYYERNARLIITRWHYGDGLSDYARREWNGLLRDYYLPRWEAFAAKNAPEALDGRNPVALKTQFHERLGGDYALKPVGDPVEVSRRLYAKYRDEFMK
jgi:alpha-N-acetylglucosaminidase